jgi:hypothetical protein
LAPVGVSSWITSRADGDRVHHAPLIRAAADRNVLAATNHVLLVAQRGVQRERCNFA